MKLKFRYGIICLIVLVNPLFGVGLYTSLEIEHSGAEDDNMVGLSPVGHWHLNEVAVGAGSVIDVGSGGNDGTPTNMENADCNQVDQKLGAACLEFDGVNEYVTFGDVLDFARTDTYSLECWAKITSGVSGAQLLITKTTAAGVGYLVYYNANTKVFIVQMGDDVGKTIFCGTTRTFAFDTFHHVVATYNGSSTHAGFKLYINGVNQSCSRSGITLTGDTTHATALTIGDDVNNGGPLEGLLDEVAIYDVVLSAEDVIARYNAGVGNESMTTVTWDISTLTNIIKFEIDYMTLDEGVPYATLQVVDNVVPADWYINFTDKLYFGGAQSDTTIFKGLVNSSRTRRDDASGIKTFILEHFCMKELLYKPNGAYGQAADLWDDILEDIIDDGLTNITYGVGTIDGSTTVNAKTYRGTRSFLSIIRESCEADKHIPFLKPDGTLYKETPTTSQGLTWTDANCRWLGSRPAGPRPNQVIATGVGITSTKNATDTSYQTKYGVISVDRFKSIDSQVQLDNWAQGYIDNLVSDNYFIFLSTNLASQGLLQAGQTVNYASAQMVLVADDYIVKWIKYNALLLHGMRIKLSLGVGFRSQGTVKEQIDEAIEQAANTTSAFNTHAALTATAHGGSLGRIATGTYTGNGANDRVITSSLDFSPKFMIFNRRLNANGLYYPYHVSDAYPANGDQIQVLWGGVKTANSVVLDAAGFTVYPTGGNVDMNTNLDTLYWVAFG